MPTTASVYSTFHAVEPRVPATSLPAFTRARAQCHLIFRLAPFMPYPSANMKLPTNRTSLTTATMQMRVAQLRPSDRNPRTISSSRFENLKRSLEQDREFLYARPRLLALVGIGTDADDEGYDPTPPAEPVSRLRRDTRGSSMYLTKC